MFKYAYPVMLAGLAFTVNENLDNLLLRDMVDESEAGAYAGCYKIATLMILMVTDVVDGGSRLVLAGQVERLNDLPYRRLSDGTLDAPELVSRKKQLLPVLLALLE